MQCIVIHRRTRMEAFIESKNIQNFTTNCLYSDPWYRPDLTFGKFQRKSMTSPFKLSKRIVKVFVSE